VAFFGQKTYNGVALISKNDASDVVKNIPGFADEQARVIAGTVNGVRVVGGYFPNGQEPGSEKFAYKMRWLEALREWLRSELQAHDKLVLMGDFNIAPEDRDSYDPVGLKDTIHHTVEEREHFQSLLDLGLTDAFRQFEQPEKSFSWWDYREFGFRRNRGLRIDHILVSAALRESVQGCVIDKTPRKNERPSDHTPVVVTLA
jgi:exodeoxyribonuclease-3